ncbi:MAG: hypothetical protein CBC55_02190 [Gammaproteobacteria bacterium TMED95]|nr:MAG: hypothetical protein CBC55_02190 [Gammaproteobacteria bacterium TMED95]
MTTPTTLHRVPKSFTCLFTPSHKHCWDIYEDDQGRLHAISTTSPEGDSRYGDHDHMLKTMSRPGFNLIPTEAGARKYAGAVVPLPSDYFERVDHYAKMRGFHHHFSVKQISQPSLPSQIAA